MRMIECQWLAHALASDGAPNEVGSVGAAAQLDRGGIGERDIGDADRPATRISRGVAEGPQLFEIGSAGAGLPEEDTASGGIEVAILVGVNPSTRQRPLSRAGLGAPPR